MREQDALELIDAHLDDEELTEQQAQDLTGWLKQSPQHAERAFHRVFLHTFLRRRLQARQLAPTTSRTDLIATEIDGERPAELIVPQPLAAPMPGRGSRHFSRWLVVTVPLIAAGAVAAALMLPATIPPAPNAEAYDGFDYPATSIPAPLTEAQSWPTTGGLQGLDGGEGWDGPWMESGTKVGVIVDHSGEMNWDPKDMRKFKPLGYTDAHGRTLRTTGRQMRTAMGVRSLTSRKLRLDAFPDAMRDESGLGKDGSVIWFSFLAQSFNSTAENNRFTYFQIGSREVSGFRIGKIGAAPSGNWTATGLLTGAQVNLRSSTVPSGEMAFLVTRIEFGPGPEEAAVWINPSLAEEPKLTEATLRLSVPDFRFDGITINANYSTDLDEIRFGQSFRAVAPIE